ncbi:Signal transduction histidine kinase [Halopseudomonas litoralis]|uniref:histidine kinase n=1 Tax=Halopseudomonas litoralis TaxID=797277 RepID=A0A1H1PB09_9GAMM|nr:sensor histidine kinase [Halopseudomonas litoralis]SDS07799.1 Signal transduction histidine kinase [Halopseudomonas litoralis]
MKSIGRQLGGGLLLVLLLTVMLVGQGSVWLFDRALRDYLSNDLQRETDALLAALMPGADGLYLDLQRVSPDYQRPFSGRYFVLQTTERWRSRSLWDQRLPLDAEGLENTLIPGPAGQRLLVHSGRFSKLGESVSISVAMDYQPLLQAFSRARLWLWSLGGLAVVVSLLIQQGLLRRALRPLHRSRRELSEWHAGQRLVLSDDVPQELVPLVGQINHLGAQVEQTIQRSRKGVGDLGHALKTPLAVTESLVRQADLDAEAKQAITAQLEGIRRQLERALQRSRLAPESQAGKRFSPRQDLPWLMDSLRQIHGERVRISAPENAGAEWPFEREDMLELLGNLLDNACKWADGLVRVDWQLSGQLLQLQVEDDGRGIDGADRDRVLRRGTRLDESVSGHGFGLAIVGDLVEVYGGELELQDSELGGLAVRVRLPVSRR